MPRKHIHKPGTAYRRNYPEANVERALEAIVTEGFSFGQAADRWEVPKATLWRKYRGLTSDKLGRPPALSVLEEKNIVNALTTSARFGYPFNREELKELIQQYLTRKGATIRCFEDNKPGDEWCKNFENRNPELTRRNCENMKRAKAQLSEEVISNYFSELEMTILNVPPENILNYDETNISDDPGRKKVFVKKGTKHAPRIIDSSKSSNSVMFAALGDGTLLPPYIVYRAKNIYPEWTQNGPPGTRFNRSKNGWFDSVLFEDWFVTIALPALKRKTGKKIVLGDNLSSHLSIKILQLCEENNIAFAFFPPNSTHVCQPLDVAVFGPLKKKWRAVLTQWKAKNRGVVPKTEFPSLIHKLLQAMQPTMSQNIKSGFESCGIIPFNPDKVKNKLIGPRRNPDVQIQNAALSESFEQIMSDKTTVNEKKQPKRSKKILIAAGKSIDARDLSAAGPSQRKNHSNSEESDNNTETVDNSIGNASDISAEETANRRRKRSKKVTTPGLWHRNYKSELGGSDINRHIVHNSISDESDDVEETDSSEEEIGGSVQKQSYSEVVLKKPNTAAVKEPVRSFNDLRKNMFIIVGLVYNENSKKECIKEFLGRIISLDETNITVSFLRNYKGKRNMFIFPTVSDVSQVRFNEIKYTVSAEPIVCRGIYTFSGDLV